MTALKAAPQLNAIAGVALHRLAAAAALISLVLTQPARSPRRSRSMTMAPSSRADRAASWRAGCTRCCGSSEE